MTKEPPDKETDLSNDDSFLDSRPLVMGIIGAFVLRNGGSLKITHAEIAALENKLLGFTVEDDGIVFYLTSPQAT